MGQIFSPEIQKIWPTDKSKNCTQKIWTDLGPSRVRTEEKNHVLFDPIWTKAGPSHNQI